MILRVPSGSAIPIAPTLGKNKGKQQDLDDLLEKHKTRWELAERRLNEIWEGRGNLPLIGDVNHEMKIKRDAEAAGYRPPSLSKGKEREEQEEIPGPTPRAKPPAPPLQGDSIVTSQPQDDFIPSKSEEDLIKAMREGGVDEEEIELVKALTFSLSDEVEGE